MYSSIICEIFVAKIFLHLWKYFTRNNDIYMACFRCEYYYTKISGTNTLQMKFVVLWYCLQNDCSNIFFLQLYRCCQSSLVSWWSKLPSSFPPTLTLFDYGIIWNGRRWTLYPYLNTLAPRMSPEGGVTSFMATPTSCFTQRGCISLRGIYKLYCRTSDYIETITALVNVYSTSIMQSSLAWWNFLYGKKILAVYMWRFNINF